MLCMAVGIMVALLAAPSKRVLAVFLVGLPFIALGFAALVSSRRAFLHEQAYASLRSEQPVSGLVPNPEAFVREAPMLAARFNDWAGDRAPRGAVSVADLEQTAKLLGDSIALESELFLPWVAAVGEAHRIQCNGSWSIAKLIGRGEPVVVSGRFPYKRMRPLPIAIELLDVSSTLEHV